MGEGFDRFKLRDQPVMVRYRNGGRMVGTYTMARPPSLEPDRLTTYGQHDSCDRPDCRQCNLAYGEMP